MPELVAITGATGFIGSVLVNKLIQNNWAVRALTRTARFSDSNTIEWIEGDLGNLNALRRLVDGSSHVIHCAATVKGNTFEEFAYTNIEGTKNILSAVSTQQPSSKFLLISSLAARQPELSWYAQSKYLSEQQLLGQSQTLDWTIFRPTAVYGPGDKELKPLFQAMHRGILPIVGKITNRFGLIHVEDLVAAILAWLQSENAVEGIFELDDGQAGGYSYQSLITLAEQVWSHPIRGIAIPDYLIRNIASANLWLAKLLRYPAMLTPGKVNELQHPDWVCDNTKLMATFPAWCPRIRLQDALPEIIKS